MILFVCLCDWDNNDKVVILVVIQVQGCRESTRVWTILAILCEWYQPFHFLPQTSLRRSSVSLNVFKNCVPVMIHSHINCTLFLHRSKVHTFLSVSLNCLHEMIQSNTGCICLTFLHCVFSASSNRLHPPLCVFKRVLKEGAKSHWLHLFDFSPLCAFKSVLKTYAREDAKSH